MLYTQIFESLYQSLEYQESRDIIPVHIFMNDFDKIGKIHDLTKYLACFSHNITVSMMLPSLCQFKEKYKSEYDWKSIVTGFDVWSYYGSDDPDSWEIMSQKLGMIARRSKVYSNKKASFPLMPSEEIENLPPDKCIVCAPGIKPVLDYKYDSRKHPRFSQTGESSVRNCFDYDKLFDDGRTPYRNG